MYSIAHAIILFNFNSLCHNHIFTRYYTAITSIKLLNLFGNE